MEDNCHLLFEFVWLVSIFLKKSNVDYLEEEFDLVQISISHSGSESEQTQTNISFHYRSNTTNSIDAH